MGQVWRRGLCVVGVFVACAVGEAGANGQEAGWTWEPGASVPEHGCSVDLSLPGTMSDIVSNALMLGLDVDSADVDQFLDSAQERYATGAALVRATAERFGLDEEALLTEVEAYRHVNCFEADGSVRVGDVDVLRGAAGEEVSAFARDVTLHVVLHEIGHALIREFDLPVLGNEETAADAFATYYLTTFMPERAARVLTARVQSLMIEAGEAEAVLWSGEHNHDGRRAFQIAALAVAADAARYAPVADAAGMSEEDVAEAREYGSEIRRSWRRVLRDLWMPEGEASSEARVVWDGSPFLASLRESGLGDEVESALRRFDWHSQVTVRFVEGDGGAGWNRGRRTVTVHSGYVKRFVRQGEESLLRSTSPE